MAETIVAANSLGADYGSGSVTAITVTAASDSVIRTITIPLGATRLYFAVKNVHASVAFDEFKIKRRPHASAAWSLIASINTDYSSPAVPLLEVTGAPVTLAAAATVHVRMDVEGTDAVQILASGNAAASTAELYYRMQ